MLLNENLVEVKLEAYSWPVVLLCSRGTLRYCRVKWYSTLQNVMGLNIVLLAVFQVDVWRWTKVALPWLPP